MFASVKTKPARAGKAHAVPARKAKPVRSDGAPVVHTGTTVKSAVPSKSVKSMRPSINSVVKGVIFDNPGAPIETLQEEFYKRIIGRSTIIGDLGLTKACTNSIFVARYNRAKSDLEWAALSVSARKRIRLKKAMIAADSARASSLAVSGRIVAFGRAMAKMAPKALMDLVMPNGKMLRYCTGEEVATFGDVFAVLAKKVKSKQEVGMAMTDKQVFDLFAKVRAGIVAVA